MNTVVDIVRSWAASDSSVNPTKEILEWVEQRNATVKVRIDKTDFEKDGFWYYNEEEGCICNRNHSFFFRLWISKNRRRKSHNRTADHYPE